MNLPFNKPYLVGKELEYIAQAHDVGHISGDGGFTRRCSAWLEQQLGCRRALLTHSCTAALEMTALLAGICPGDEVIMPSFTFVSTANAFALRGGVPVFVDIRPDTLNIDPERIEAAVTSRTRAIVVVHYAGVGCDMDAIMAIAHRRRLLVIEDAAHGLLASRGGRPLGSVGHLATLSFHETKNAICGEGGALLVNDERFVDRAQIIRDKGTNRSSFLRGEVAKYTWVDVGSSYLPSEVTAAFLWAQMEQAEAITARRRAIWSRYHDALAGLDAAGRLRRPTLPPDCVGNAHLYYVLLPDPDQRAGFIERLRARGVDTVFHYVPLHDSPAGRRYGRASGSLAHTEALSRRLVRLPLWLGIEEHLPAVIDAIHDTLA